MFFVFAGSSLEHVCTAEYARSKLPASDFIQGISLDATSVTANTVYNVSTPADGTFFPAATFSYCNVTMAYSHDGKDDRVLVKYWLPEPSKFQNRYLSTGGGGYAINSGDQSLPGGVMYGAVAGATDGGFGGFSVQADAVMLLANGTLNYDTLYMFAYRAQRELGQIGKQFTRNFFDMAEETKLYSYYQGCSEGGREGWSQIQRYADQFDGAAIGAPAFRWSFQQTQHLYSNIVTKTLGYFPPPCEMQKILNETISACDSLDGLKDGVVSRSDLCQLHFDFSSVVGKTYYCAASAGTGWAPATPEQNGTVTTQGVEVAKKVIQGLHDSQGRRVYLSYQIAASFDDVTTQYNSSTGKWELSVNGLGGEYIALLVDKIGTTLPDLDGVTYDTLKSWMINGMRDYGSTLQTDWPDLAPFHEAGGKVIHFHGEADASIPAASSVRYWESVRSVMYPQLSYQDGAKALKDWYQLYLVPGAAHCSTNPLMPNGPFPQTNMQVLINWVEKGQKPVTLNATVLQGGHAGENRQICGWPLRPKWKGGVMQCEYDQQSIETWHYDFTGVPMPVY
ncbi:Tannase/feruloyl esterase [Aspergillus ambiguus]|uniref:putative tannase n=1 Tax=Aspergillus ambiguus TaxID=176160 RepID=UPI003CCCE7A7